MRILSKQPNYTDLPMPVPSQAGANEQQQRGQYFKDITCAHAALVALKEHCTEHLYSEAARALATAASLKSSERGEGPVAAGRRTQSATQYRSPAPELARHHHHEAAQQQAL